MHGSRNTETHAGRRARERSDGRSSQARRCLARWIARRSAPRFDAIRHQGRRTERTTVGNDRGRLAAARIDRPCRRCVQVERISTVMLNGRCCDSERLIACGLVSMIVIEMQPSRFLVMIGRFVHMGHPGHDAERQVKCTAAKCEDLTHRPDCIREPRRTAVCARNDRPHSAGAAGAVVLPVRRLARSANSARTLSDRLRASCSQARRSSSGSGVPQRSSGTQ